MVRAPFPFPLKEPVDVLVGEVLVDETDTAEVEVLLTVEPKLVVEREEERPETDELKVPEEEGEELEERAGSTWNWAVWESTVVTSPTGEAWRVYPEPGGTAGKVTVIVPSAVVTMFLTANVLLKLSLVR